MDTRETITLACALAVALAMGGCSENDPNDATGVDAGGDPTAGGGRAGTGGSSGGSGSSTGGAASGSNAGSGAGRGGSGAGSGGSGSGSDGGPGSTSDGGGSGSGSIDAGVTDGGVATMPGCAGLMQCCQALMNPERMGCELLAANADDAMCDQLQLVYCAPDPGGGSEGACMELEACCETLPRGTVRVACATTVTNGVLLDCEQLTMTLCPEGGDPNACAVLAGCCDMLPPPQAASCNTLADQGLAASCEAVLPVLCP